MALPTHVRFRLAAALALLLAASPGTASELRTTTSRVAGIVVHDAQETLRDYCRTQDGRLWLELPGGMRWELVTSTSDPLVTNPGDGASHPFDVSEVAAAMSQVRYPLGWLSAEVFILPFPRRESLESAAGPGLVLLSPGVRELARSHQHSEFVHELGHVVQYALLPDSDTQGWGDYMRIRGLASDVHTAYAAHALRPHEIWAEDFRALFGGANATEHATIENPALAYPTQVAGLAEFMRSFAADPAITPRARLTAAPLARGTVTFSRFGASAAVLDVYDAAGRRLASIQPSQGQNSVAWNWTGTDRAGRAVRGEMVFARARDGRGGAVRVVLAR